MNNVSPLREAAIQMHEMYIELKHAGFTRGEAIELIARTVGTSAADSIQKNDDGDDD
jgi:hypothetical protein